MTAPLVFPYLVSFAVLDNTGQSQPDYYNEPATREELPTEIELMAQVQPDSLGTLAMWAAGRNLDQSVILFAHRRDLIHRSLLDATAGMPTTPKIGDRLTTVKDGRGNTVYAILNPPGAFVEAVIPSSFGPGGINALYEIRLEPRKAVR